MWRFFPGWLRILLVGGLLLPGCRPARLTAFCPPVAYSDTRAPQPFPNPLPTSRGAERCPEAVATSGAPVPPARPRLRGQPPRMGRRPLPPSTAARPPVYGRTLPAHSAHGRRPGDLSDADWGKLLLLTLGVALAVLGLLAWLLAALTPAGFGAALLALVVGIPGFLLVGGGLRAFRRRRRTGRAPDGTGGTKEPRPDGEIAAGIGYVLLGLAALALAITLVSSLTFGAALLYAAAGYAAGIIALGLLGWLVYGIGQLFGN